MRIALFMLTCLFTFNAAAAKKSSAVLPDSDTVVWAGLDYSMTRMIGPGDFTDPKAIFPGFLESWNKLFLKERLESAGKALKRRLVPDINGVMERNKSATADQIVPVEGSEDTLDKTHITPEDIAKAVRACDLEASDGLGLIFIVDRLVKPDQAGAVYVVFFDVGSRDVIASERYVGRAGGFGFRNYWFGVIKNVERNLKAYR